MGSRRSSGSLDSSGSADRTKDSISLEFDDYPLDLIGRERFPFNDVTTSSNEAYSTAGHRPQYLKEISYKRFNTERPSTPPLSSYRHIDVPATTPPLGTWANGLDLPNTPPGAQSLLNETLLEMHQKAHPSAKSFVRKSRFFCNDMPHGNSVGHNLNSVETTTHNHVTINVNQHVTNIYLNDSDDEVTRQQPKPTVCSKRTCGEHVAALCRPLLRKHNPLPKDASSVQRLRHACLCPPRGPLAQILTRLMLATALITASWVVPESLGLNSCYSLRNLAIVGVVGYFLSMVLRALHLPTFLGKTFLQVHSEQMNGLVHIL